MATSGPSQHFAGVPRRIRYDNLKAAVERVLKGRDRIESDRFVTLRSHYRFDSFFCQPGIKGSHEKGGVEGEVGRFRRRHLVPVPRVASMVELNEVLAAASCSAVLNRVNRKPYSKLADLLVNPSDQADRGANASTDNLLIDKQHIPCERDISTAKARLYRSPTIAA